MEFPKYYPKWVYGFVPPKRPNTQTTFDGGGISRLRSTAISSQGQFSAEWGGVSDKVVDEIMNFWRTVEDFEPFTLPSRFFQCGNSKRLKARYASISPTGLYLFQQEPTEERLNNSLFTVQATFLGVID